MRGWLRDLGIGFRLSVGGSRNHTTSWVRLGVGAFGIALAVAVLLGAGSAGTVLAERDARAIGQSPDTQPRAGVQPTLLRSTGTVFRGDYIGGTFVQHTDATSPVPPGVPRRLAPGEMVVSPELRELLAGPGGELLRDRFTGYRIVGELAKPGVTDPGELRFVAGSDELPTASEQAGVQPVYGFGGPQPEEPMPFVLVVLVVLASVVLIVPLLIFVQTSSRIAGAERDRRLAAVRLVGADAQQVRRIAAAEALLPAALGLLLGTVLFYAIRPLAGQVRLFDVSVYPEDIVPAWWAVLLVVVAVPMLSVATVLVAMRRTVVEPLGVVRHGKPKRKRALWWRLAITAAGVGLLVASATVLRSSEDGTLLTAIGAGGVLLVLGVASLLPWAVELIISRAHGGPPTLQLAARRLQLDAGTSARVVSGIVVVLTGAVSVLLVLASVQREYETVVDAVDQHMSEWPPPMVHVPADGRRLTELRADLAAVQGVRGTHPASEVMIGGVENKDGIVLVGDCFAVRQHVALDACAEGDVFLPAGPAREPGVLDLAPGDRVPVGDGQWRVPQAAKSVNGGEGYIIAYATPKAFPAAQARPDSVTTIYLDARSAGFVEASDLMERVRNAVGLQPDVWVSNEGVSVGKPAEAQVMESVRSWIFAGAVVVLMLAALSVLVLAVEQVRERRRALAAVSAAGVGFGTLARSLLWQNAIPFGIGSLLAVGGGYVLAYLVLQIPEVPMAVDWPALGLLLGAAAVLMLLVTALSLPMLRAAVSVKNLRTE